MPYSFRLSFPPEPPPYGIKPVPDTPAVFPVIPLDVANALMQCGQISYINPKEEKQQTPLMEGSERFGV